MFLLTHKLFRDSDGKTGAIQVLSQLFKTTLNLPPRIQAICWAQFWAWIGTTPGSSPNFRKLLTVHRLVSLPVLQHHMGRRDLFPI